ncbi:chemotaxis protein, partial [Helicobacter sp. CLO-3]
MFRSLSGKLTGSSVAIFVVIIVVISFFNFQKNKGDIIDLYQGIQKQTLESAYRSIFITMGDEAQHHLKILAKNLVKVDKNDIVQQRAILDTAASLVKYPLVVVVYEDDGKTILQYYDENGIKHFSPNWDNTDGIDLRTRAWYVETKQKGAGIITPVYVSAAGKYKGQSFSTATMPLVKNGKFIGVVGFDISVDGFQDRFVSFMNSELPSTNIFLTDSDGKIFSYKEEGFVGSPAAKQVEDVLADVLHKDHLEDGIVDYDFITEDGKVLDKIGFYKSFPFGWTIVTTANKTDYTETINANLIQTIILATIMIIIGAVVIFFINRYLASPINSIKTLLIAFFKYLNHESKVAPKPLILKSHDEIGVMAQAINENIKRTE